jgi:hypothetical protein
MAPMHNEGDAELISNRMLASYLYTLARINADCRDSVATHFSGSNAPEIHQSNVASQPSN